MFTTVAYNGRLLCLLGVIFSVLSLARCSAHTLLGVMKMWVAPNNNNNDSIQFNSLLMIIIII
jgi:hypothetical protein